MGTTSSFFGGGGGGGAVLNAPNQGFVNTIDFASNTQFSVPSTARGINPRVVPCKSNTFFLLEGSSSPKVFVSYWSIDDTGAATQEATAIQIHSYADEVHSASANGVDRLIVETVSGNDRFLYHIYYNGSALTSTQLTGDGNTYGPTSTVTCNADGILMGVVSKGSSDNQYYKVAVIDPDGTTQTADFTGAMMRDKYSRLIGTGDGLIGIGRKTNDNYAMVATKLYINSLDSSALYNIAHQYREQNTSSGDYLNTNNAPYVIPTNGGAYAAYIDGNNNLKKFSITTYGRVVNVLPLNVNHPNQRYNDLQSANVLDENLGQDSTFSRQANGTYMHWNSSSFAHYVTFDPANYSHHAPFGTIRPIGDSGSSGCYSSRRSTAIVGNFVISTWYDQTNTEVNIDAWNYRG